MSLNVALTYARLHLPIVKVSRARIAATQAAAAIPKGQWLPQLGGTAQIFGATANNTTNSYLSDGSIDIPRIGGTPANTSTSWKPYAS
ncbi:MAG: hypothetical protein ACXVEE_37050, partial [Polyangiales bacterium]